MDKKLDQKIIRIYGAGGHALVVKDVLIRNGFKISETFDDNPPSNDFPLINISPGARINTEGFPHEGPPIILAIGDNRERSELSSLLNSKYGIAIHESAVIAANTEIGEGTVIFAGAIIQPNTSIGKHVIINTSASIDHDNQIGNFVHISPNVTLCGNVVVMEGTQIGSAAIIIPNVKIGKWCVIGAGAVIIKDVPDYCTVVGNPGRIIKNNSK